MRMPRADITLGVVEVGGFGGYPKTEMHSQVKSLIALAVQTHFRLWALFGVSCLMGQPHHCDCFLRREFRGHR